MKSLEHFWGNKLISSSIRYLGGLNPPVLINLEIGDTYPQMLPRVMGIFKITKAK